MWYAAKPLFYSLLFVISFTCIRLLHCASLQLHLTLDKQIYCTHSRQLVVRVCVSSSVTCCRLPLTRSVRTAWWEVTLTVLSRDVSSQHTGFGHEGHTLRSSRFSVYVDFLSSSLQITNKHWLLNMVGLWVLILQCCLHPLHTHKDPHYSTFIGNMMVTSPYCFMLFH